MLPNSLYESNITLIPKPDKDIKTNKKKLQKNIPDEQRLKNPQKKLADRIQRIIKRFIHHEQVEFIPGMVRYPQNNQCDTPH